MLEISTEYKKVETQIPVIVLKLDKTAAMDLSMALFVVLKEFSGNIAAHRDYDTVKKFQAELHREVNSKK